MRDLAGLKHFWLAVVAAGVLAPLVVAAERPSPTPGVGAAGWIVGELRPFAFGRARAAHRASTLAQLHRLGWLECAGQSLAADEFPELHEAISESWGKGPKGAFLIPDLRGLFLRGWPSARNEETYRQLMGGDLLGSREDEPTARVRPDGAEVTYFIYVGRDVSRRDEVKGARER
jgi:hypothetical protein